MFKKLVIFTCIFTLLSTFVYAFNRPCYRLTNIITVKGEIESFDPPFAEIKTKDNSIIAAHIGPIWYWTRIGYINTGETVTINGFIVNGILNVISIETPNRNIILRNPSGVPIWTGNRFRRY